MRATRVILAALLAAAAVPSVTAGGALFGPSASAFPVPGSPGWFALGDFDTDGVPDAAISVDDGGGALAILRNDGRGGFSRAATIPVGVTPAGVLAADLDADGDADLAVAAFGGNAVGIALGDGQGGFAPVIEIPDVGTRPVALAAGDFDLDGILDLAVANRNDDTVGILFGDGDGGFSGPAIVSGVGPFPFDLEAVDLNGDGFLDLAVANLQGNDLTILRGDGSGGFAPVADVAVGASPRAVRSGDLNGDGTPDLVVANSGSDSVSVLPNDGTGGFGSAFVLEVAADPVALAVVDLDGDGRLDLAVAGGLGDSVTLLLGDGEGRFTRACRGTPPAGGCDEITVPGPWWLAAADLDGNGAPDLAVSSRDAGLFTVLAGDGLGGVVRATEVAVGEFPESLAAADFNGDGLSDLAVAETGAGSVGILLSDGLGGLVRTAGVAGVADSPTGLAAADLDRDGSTDLAVPGFDDATVHVLRGDGAGSFFPYLDLPARANPSGVLVEDLDRDGDPDLAVVHSSSFTATNVVRILKGGEGGVFELGQDIEITRGEASAALGDFDGDGTPDIAVTVAVPTVAGDTLQILVGAGDGSFAGGPIELLASRPSDLAAGDFDGDGDLDLAVTSTEDRVVTILPGLGDGRFGQGVMLGVGDGPSAIVAADLNRDGVPDLAVSDVFDDSVTLLLGDGTGGFRPVQQASVGSEPRDLVLLDLDGDALPDLASVHRGGASVAVLFNRLDSRADINGSNRVDGFDALAIALRAGTGPGDTSYRVGADVDLNGAIDGDDLAAVAGRFGELDRRASLLRAVLPAPAAPPADSVTLRPVASAGDLVTVEVVVNVDDPVTAADFALTFGPDDGAPEQVLAYEGFDSGSYLAGGVGQIFAVDDRAPGRINVTASRLPIEDRVVAGQQTLVSVVLRARRPGRARLGFEPFRRSAPALLDSAGMPAPGVVFPGNVILEVDASAGGPPGQKIGIAPSRLDFGRIAPGAVQRRRLRLSNFGFSDLRIDAATSSLAGFFVAHLSPPATIESFGFVELSIDYTPAEAGIHSGDLIILSNDPTTPRLEVPVVGRASTSLGVTATRLDFGAVDVGSEKRLLLGVTNQGGSELALDSVASSDARFAPGSSFSVLPPGGRREIEVRFRPDEAGDARGLLAVVLTGTLDQTLRIPLTGTGR